MAYTYEQRKRPRGQTNTPPARTAAAGPVSAPLRADTAGAGNTDALDAAMRERMTRTFGDLSAVKDYLPPARTQAPAPAAPYTGPVTHTLSGASPSPAAAGPMQAKRRDADAKQVKQMKEEGENYNGMYATPDYAGYDDLDPNQWETKTHRPGFTKIFGKKDQTYKVRNKSGLIMDQSKIDRTRDLSFTPEFGGNVFPARPGMDELEAVLEKNTPIRKNPRTSSIVKTGTRISADRPTRSLRASTTRKSRINRFTSQAWASAEFLKT